MEVDCLPALRVVGQGLAAAAEVDLRAVGFVDAGRRLVAEGVAAAQEVHRRDRDLAIEGVRGSAPVAQAKAAAPGGELELPLELVVGGWQREGEALEVVQFALLEGEVED